ncbi:unnamed protein product, partial [Symbiodinium microadriaticum]
CTIEWCEANYIRHRALKLAKNIRGQLLGDAENARRSGSSQQQRKRVREKEDSEEARYRHGDNRSGRSCNRSLERAIQRCLVSGLYMNAARRCANETAFRSMNLKLTPNEQRQLDSETWGLRDMLEDVKLLHLHPTSSFATEGVRPPEYIVFQDLLFASRALMRHVCKYIIGFE